MPAPSQPDELGPIYPRHDDASTMVVGLKARYACMNACQVVVLAKLGDEDRAFIDRLLAATLSRPFIIACQGRGIGIHSLRATAIPSRSVSILRFCRQGRLKLVPEGEHLPVPERVSLQKFGRVA
jgi:hypothetical protein